MNSPALFALIKAFLCQKCDVSLLSCPVLGMHEMFLGMHEVFAQLFFFFSLKKTNRKSQDNTALLKEIWWFPVIYAKAFSFFFFCVSRTTFDCVKVKTFLEQCSSGACSPFQVYMQYTSFHLLFFWHSTT